MLFKVVATALATALLAGCVATDRPTTTQTQLLPIEAQKKEIAQLRDRGTISYEEAARRQFEIQRANYALSDGEVSFWRASIEYARQVDSRQIKKSDYRRLVAAAYQYYVVEKKTSKPTLYKL